MEKPLLILKQTESDWVYFCKGWYYNHWYNEFWSTLEAIQDDIYMWRNLGDTYCTLRHLLTKLLTTHHNPDYVWGEYDKATMPSEAWRVPGFKDKFPNMWGRENKYDDEDLLKARIAALASLIGVTEVLGKYELKPFREIAGLRAAKEAKKNQD